MATLQIEKENALKAFNKADSSGKTLLTDLFGKEVFSQKITDQVKTFEDACEILGIDPDDALPDVSSDALVKDAVSITAYCKLIIIARALNEGWTPDWSNRNQSKYVAWFTYKSGSGLSCDDCGILLSFTSVGSRLCFKSSELAIYAGQQFEDIYRDYLTIN